MTVNDYIQQKFQPLDIALSEADLSDLVDTFNVYPEDNKSKENICQIKRFMLKIMGERLDSLPTSISESGFSMSWSEKRLYSFYASLCSDLGIDNKYSNKPKCTFL